MVKGITRRVVVIKTPDPHVFDEAIFIVKDDALHRGVTNEEVLKEAQDVAQNYIANSRGRGFLSRIPAPLFALFGAGITALVWFLTQFIR